MVNFLRITCLLLAMLGLAAAWIWEERSPWVSAFDYHATKFAGRKYPERLGHIKAGLSERDMADSLRELDGLRKDCGDVDYDSRHFPVWRDTVGLLTEKLEGLGRYDEILPILEDAVKRDPTNIPLHMRYASSLAMVGGASNLKLAEQVTDAWKFKIPTYPDWVNACLLRLVKEGDAKNLAHTLAVDLKRSRAFLMSGWQLYLFPQGEGVLAKSPLSPLAELGGKGGVVLEHTFESSPSDLGQLRLDAPIFITARMSELSVRMWIEEKAVDQGAGWSWSSPVAIERLPGGSFAIQASEDPRLHMRFQEPLSAGGRVRVRVEFVLDPIASQRLRALLAEPGLREQVIAHLQAIDPELDLNLLAPLPQDRGEKPK